MQEQDNTEASRPGFIRRLWASRRSFRGFGLLLFYCHMLMLFSALARYNLASLPECALLLKAGGILVPTLFTLTSVSLFIPCLFWPAAALGLAHIPFAAVMLARAPIVVMLWYAGLIGLMMLLVVSIKWKISGKK